jgi:hypothetical protein
MHITLDGAAIALPRPGSLGELLEALVPHVDPDRTITDVEVDGRAADFTDAVALAAWRLAGSETVAVTTLTPAEFAAERRGQIVEHLRHIAERLGQAAESFAHGDLQAGNRLLATGSRDLGLVLELDQHLAVIEGGAPRCAGIVGVLERCGTRLTEAQHQQRWDEVARLLSGELVPALRASA